MPRLPKRTWWKETFIYQIYPRSFKDSNGDGIGDLRGIIQSLDYLQKLRVETLWLSPIYSSPNEDNGYDVSDYYGIMAEFGSMADFDELLLEAKRRNIRLILDLVVNHSSSQHHWFQAAKKSKDNPYRDYYIWREGKGDQPPNNYLAFFGGSAWEYNEATGDYYLHYFAKGQPDLNWEHPKLRQEIYQMMRFWLDKGVDGFRMDVIPFISKHQDFPDAEINPENPLPDLARVYSSGPRLHEFLQEMRREVFDHYEDKLALAEGIGITRENVLDFIGPDREELDISYHFDHMYVDRGIIPGVETYQPLVLKQVINGWNQAMGGKAMNTLYFGNHDQPRPVSRFGEDTKYHEVSAKMLATLLFTQPAIPFVYQGEEIGMTNVDFESIEQIDDIATLNDWAVHQRKGGDWASFKAGMARFSRDHARTPFQWDRSRQAGFSSAEKTWITVNPNFPRINAAAAMSNPQSIWYYYQELIRLRRKHLVLIYGNFTDIAPDHPAVYAYIRELAGDRIVVLLNLTDQEINFEHKILLDVSKLLIKNYTAPKKERDEIILRPFEALVFEM